MKTSLRTANYTLRENGRGFSLLEITLVLLIISLVMGFIVTARVAVVTHEKRDLTVRRMDAIHDAIVNGRRVFHRLPCPAPVNISLSSATFGKETRTTDCPETSGGQGVARGSVPTKTLGLSDEHMYDGWGRRFSFFVLSGFGEDCAFVTHPVGDTSYGGMAITDAGGTARTNMAVYALVSHGPNGHGGYLPRGGQRFGSGSLNAGELENCDCDSALNAGTVNAVLVDAGYSESGSDARYRFDDIVRYYTREQILAPTDETGEEEVCP